MNLYTNLIVLPNDLGIVKIAKGRENHHLVGELKGGRYALVGLNVDGVVMHTAIVLPKGANGTIQPGGGSESGGQKNRLVGELKAGKYPLMQPDSNGMIINTAIVLQRMETRLRRLTTRSSSVC